MSTGFWSVRGALFELVIALTGAGVIAGEPVSSPEAPLRLRWLSDLGSESTMADGARSRTETTSVLAPVPGAAYVLSIENGSAHKRRRIAADYSMVYGLSGSARGEWIVAAEDGSLSHWRGLLDAEGPSRRWTRSLDERTTSVGWDGGDSIWVGTRRNRLIALSSEDGETQWSVSLGGRAEAPPLRVGEALFVATKDETLLKLDASTGKAKWKVELPGPVNHPPAAGGEGQQWIVVATWNGRLTALRADTGETLWSVELGSRTAGAPIATEALAVVATEDGSVRAYDLNGEPVWKMEGAAGERTDLFLQKRDDAEKRLVVVSTTLSIRELSTGKVLEDYPAGARKDAEERFLNAMLEGRQPYSESEKSAILERESFPIRGRLFGRAQLFGNDLVFGTEDGWVYWFDAGSLRPLCRYRAGQRALSLPVWAPETLVAAASDAVFGLDPESGEPLWHRDVGPVTQIAAGDEIAVVGEDRIDVLDPHTGSRRWSARGEYRAVAPVTNGAWLAFARDGEIQALDTAGAPIGSAIERPEATEAIATLGEDRWAAASREGRVSAIALDESGSLEGPIWEVDVEPSVVALHSAGSSLIVVTEARLVGLSIQDGTSLWEIPIDEGDSVTVDEQVFVSGELALKVFDASTGELVKEVAVESRALGAAIVGSALIWLDDSGTAHRILLQSTDGEQRVDLGEPLSRARFGSGSFLVTTRSGEVGFVEMAVPADVALSGTPMKFR